MEIAENTKWVIIEVLYAGHEPELFFSPETLRLPYGFAGNLLWYVFTPGWELSPTEGVVFPDGSNFEGSVPQHDPTRPNCWNAAAFNEEPGIFPYHVKVQNVEDPRIVITHDPVVENEPPPGPNLLSRREARAAGAAR